MNRFSKEVLRLVILAGLLVAFQTVAWTDAPGSPPDPNAAAPLNVSGIAQTKAGGLILNTAGVEYGLSVIKGSVGIGTLTPVTKLQVVDGKAQADDFCLNSDPSKCLTNAGSGSTIGQKVCMPNNSGDNWFVPLHVPSSWTISDCQKLTQSSAHPFNAAGRYQVGCIFSNTASFSAVFNQNALASPPSPNCGW